MLEGFLLGGVFYLLALLLSLVVFQRYSPISQRIFCVVLLCWAGHFICAYIYTLQLSDSFLYFFKMATPEYTGLGTDFVTNLTWYVRYFITGDSYLATIFFFSAFAFIGSVLWYLLFLQLAESVGIQRRSYLFPALVIMFWPSF